MKILHTSDWHLGRYLYRQKRYEEFEAFLNWLVKVIEEEQIDALIVAGDIFDNTTPSNQAQKLYYRFLAKVASGGCRNIVITAGNHDSPSFLNAPSQILEALNVFVIGNASEENPENEVIMLQNKDGDIEGIVCAVPYLRERDIRKSETGENATDKNERLIEGIQKHYSTVCEIAEEKRKKIEEESGKRIPLIATGHLFTAGGQTSDGDGVRELYIGSIGHIKSDIFPGYVDYVALGHLHIPQKVGKSDNIRYSGSPIPMSFGEAKQEKSVVIVDFNAEKPSVRLSPVPCFQKLERIKGDIDNISSRIKELSAENADIWIEVEYTGKNLATGLKEELELLVENTQIEVLRVINRRIIENVLSQGTENETLDDLDEKDVFERCLDTHEIQGEQRTMLIDLYAEVLQHLHEADSNAE
jgi:exonuclease SbcD